MTSFCDIGSQGLALVGNPGAGKSTILNGIANKPVFKTGISLGTGLTTVLQQHQFEDVNLTLFDTPGLADIERRVQAGKEIDKVLQTNMPIKLAFVVTLERGRVRPDDAATIKVVLEAIKSVDVNNRFGVIFNQLSKAELEKLNEDAEGAALVRKSITGKFETSHWIYVSNMPELEDAKDQKLMTPELLNFFCGLPLTKPADAEVEEIDTRGLQDVIEAQREMIQELERASETLKAEMKRELELYKQEAEKRETEVRESIAKLEREWENSEMEKNKQGYRLRRITNGLWNSFALITGAATSVALSNPAPMIAACAVCKTSEVPQ